MIRATRTVSLAVLLLTATLAPAQNADEIIDRYIETVSRSQYAGVQGIRDRQTDGELASVIAYTHCRGGRERQKYDRHRAYDGTVIGEQDGYRIVYIPCEKRLYRWRGAPSAAEREHELRRRFDWFEAEYAGSETVAGRRAHKIRLKPKGGRGPDGLLWIDAEQFVRLGTKLSIGDTTLFDYRFERISFRPVRDDELRYDPPDGVTVIDMPSYERRRDGERRREAQPPPMRYTSAAEFYRRTGVRPMVLGRLPEGFRLDGFLHHPPEPDNVFRRRISMHYLRGEQLVLLTMGGFPGGEPVGETPREVRPKVFFWRKGAVRLALIGPRELSSEALRGAAESVRWAEVR